MAKVGVVKDDHGLCLVSRGEVFRPQIPSLFGPSDRVNTEPLTGSDFVIVNSESSFEVWISHGTFTGKTATAWVPGERVVTYNGEFLTIGPCIGSDVEVADRGHSDGSAEGASRRHHPAEGGKKKATKQVSSRKRTDAA